MDTETLRWFQQVVDGVRVTEVADVVGVSQPGVSRALARLEAEVGTPLLHRTGRTLRPTHAGTVFKRHVDAALHDLDDALAAVTELADPETGTVTLAFPLSLGTWLVPALVSAFRDTHPRVRFRLRVSEDAAGSPLVTEGRVDLELTARRPTDPDTHWEHLFSQDLALAVPPGHRLAGRATVALAEVADEDFVMLRGTWTLRAHTESLCTAAGFTPRVSLEGDDLPVVHGLVAAGLGVAVVPVPGVGRGFGGGFGGGFDTDAGTGGPAEPLVALSDAGAHREIGLAWSRGRRLLPAADRFREAVLLRARSAVR